MESWLLVFFTILPGGNQFTGTEANYIQFKNEAECRSAEKDLNGISQKILNINGNAYSPVAICMKNGTPVLHPKVMQK
jgi:hypothetical protein